MDKFKEIRPIVLGIAKKENKILVVKNDDEVTKKYFYRCLGGGIEHLETSKEALKREYKEELGMDIEIDNFCGVIENIFTYQGKNAHELIFLYNIKIKKEDIKDSYYIIDKDKDKDNSLGACWIDINEFINKQKILYPEEIFDYI